jgi:hypothetical protein
MYIHESIPLPAPVILIMVSMLPTIIKTVHAQDSTWNDLGTSPERFTIDESIRHISTGFFPLPNPQAFSLSLVSTGGDVYDTGEGIRSRAFHPTTFPFSWHNPFNGGERKIASAFSHGAGKSYPTTNYYEIGLSFRHHLTILPIPYIGVSMQYTEGLLFSNDTTREFLSLGGLRHQLKEVGVVYLEQYGLRSCFGITGAD